MTSRGTFVDDLLVHKISDTHYMLCVNAGNQDHDYEHIVEHNKFGAQVENAGPRYSQLAIQGPRAKEILQRLTPVALDSIHYYHFAFGKVKRRGVLDRAYRLHWRRWLRNIFCARTVGKTVE